MMAPGPYDKKEAARFMRRNFAHRGLHTKDKSVPENSLAAFEAACEAGYGMELDVQLSKDGEVVVFHDDTLNRVCGVDKRVDELTLAQLKELSLCGTNERIPLFTEMLSVVNGRGPLIVELKTGKNNRELCEKTLDILNHYDGEYCIESFDPFIVSWFRFHAPHIIRGQLSCMTYGKDVPKIRGFLLTNCLLNFLARPQFIAYEIGKYPAAVKAQFAMGAMNVGWTSREEGHEEDLDACIFEFYKPSPRFK